MGQSQNISISGGILTQQFMESLRQPRSNNPKVQPESFAMMDGSRPTSARLENDIAGAWELALEHWDNTISRVEELDLPGARRRWILPLLQLLEFEPQFLRSPIALRLSGGEQIRFPLSHRGWHGEDAPVLHTVHPCQKLDDRVDHSRGAKSPHDLLQSYLNLCPQDTWGVVTNGICLRLLRDFHHTYTKGYVEFDLQNILEERSYTDFVLLYRLCHASRFLPDQQGKTPLDYFHEQCVSSGVAVGRDLRANVIRAIESLANGFLQGELISRLQSDEQQCRGFYAEVLHVIYRIIFLLYAEQRGMMPGRSTLYAQEYSITSLRERAEGDASLGGSHVDVWEGLKVTFRMVEKGVPELGIFPFNGSLFSMENTSTLVRLACRNEDLLRAIQDLTFVTQSGMRQRINYADLSVEEIGSIYESLLDYAPRVTSCAELIDKRSVPANRFVLDPRGSTRRISASYYTHPHLVSIVIESTLKPVCEERIRNAIGVACDASISPTALSKEQRDVSARAILGIRVCDPACGSGAFLIGADTYLGQELAKMRTGDQYPTETEVRRARRDVLSQCIYGVDLNPMAVELCKVSLWINACAEKYPLNFLDHHIKAGNSLIGVLPEQVAGELPDEAFDPLTGDDRRFSRAIKKRNRDERGTQWQRKLDFSDAASMPDPKPFRELSELPENEPAGVALKRSSYQSLLSDAVRVRMIEVSDFWCAAFFWQLTPGQEFVPTYHEFISFINEPHTIPGKYRTEIAKIAKTLQFFHWHWEFPEVFEQGGFDVVLGNPPWERIKVQQEEYWGNDAYISRAANKAQRSSRLDEYKNSDDASQRERVRRYDLARFGAEAQSKFLRHSGRFPLTACGDINTYAVFSELFRSLLNPSGRAGILVPTGIATDSNTRNFFTYLLDTHSLSQLVGFENEAFIFPDVHHAFKFCALAMTGEDLDVQESDFVFLCRHFEQVEDRRRHFRLSAEDFALLNPNTRTCPIFRTGADAELTKKIYGRVPVLIAEQKARNPWGIKFLRMIDMANDSGLFRSVPAQDRLPLYEAKMMHQFDHRFATYEEATQANLNAGILPQPTQEQKQDLLFAVQPKYWLDSHEVILRSSVVPPGLISAYRAKDDRLVCNELLTWIAGYHYNHEGVRSGADLLQRMLSLTNTSSTLLDIDLCREIDRDYPLSEQEIQVALEFCGDSSSLLTLSWVFIEARAPKWFVGFRRITSSVVERTMISCVLPRSAASDVLPLCLSQASASLQACLVANMNSLCFDFVARQKVGGTHMDFHYLKQLPTLPPDYYSETDLLFVVPRVAELTYTAWDIKPFADDVWRDSSTELRAAIQSQWDENSSDTGGIQVLAADGAEQAEGGIDLPPFRWDDERRAAIRAELDAYYAKLYGLTEQELRYILDPKDMYGKDFPSETFRVLQQRDEQRYGEFKTRTRILDAWRKLQ